MAMSVVQRSPLQSLFTVTRGEWRLGAKISGTTPFKSQENALFDIKKALQKRHFCSFAEKGRGPDPEDPLVARLHCDRSGVAPGEG